MNPLSLLSVASLPPELAAPPVTPLTRGQKAARDFEAQLLGSLLQSMEKTFATVPGDNAMPGEDDYNYLGTQALASALAAAGGFGIAHLINRQLGSTKVTPTPGEPAVSLYR